MFFVFYWKILLIGRQFYVMARELPLGCQNFLQAEADYRLVVQICFYYGCDLNVVVRQYISQFVLRILFGTTPKRTKVFYRKYARHGFMCADSSWLAYLKHN